MKFVGSFGISVALFQVSLAILQVGQFIPADWGPNLRHFEYVKDRDDCRFGYQISSTTSQVINVFNCTKEDDDFFYVLKAMTCATASHVQNSETCEITPLLAEESNVWVFDDPDCDSVSLGVAPSSDNCCKYKLCSDDRVTRLGTRMCARGQFFDSTTFRCEHMWKDGENGAIIPLEEEETCRGRPMPADRKRNYGAIMQKCLWNWDYTNVNTYSVAEPLNCQLYYRCSTYNPTSVHTSYTKRCTGTNYWSNTQQTCVSLTQLTTQERIDCSV